MKRFRPSRYEGGGCDVENPAIDAFLADLDEVCRKHGFTIQHEDGQGAFEIVDYDEGSWLEDAHDCTGERRRRS